MACVSISVRFGHLNLKKFPQNYSAQREMTVAIFPIVRNKNFGERKKNETNVLRIERNEKKGWKKDRSGRKEGCRVGKATWIESGDEKRLRGRGR